MDFFYFQKPVKRKNSRTCTFILLLFLTIIVIQYQVKSGSPKRHGIVIFMKKKTTIDNFGKNLTRIRKAKGFTQKKLGELIGVSNRVIAYYEKETNYPPAHLIAPLSEALEVSTDELLGIKKSKLSVDTENVALWRKLRVVESLPKKDQKTILQYIDIVAKHRHATA